MRKIHTTLRLFFEAGLSIRAVARTLRVSPEVPAKAGMGESLRRAQVAGLSWPLPEGMDERALEARLFPGAGVPAPARRAIPDWAHVHTERRRKGVTLSLLWQEYKAEHPDGIHYSRFCERYRAFRQRLDGVMRQSHRAGEKLFVDYAGHTAPVVDRESGELHQAQVFVAVLGASSYTYAEATWTQTLPDWCASHVRTLQFLGGVPECVVPDNLRSAVSRAHPPAKAGADLNPTYADPRVRGGRLCRALRLRRHPGAGAPTPRQGQGRGLPPGLLPAGAGSEWGNRGSPSSSSSAGSSPHCATAPSSPSPSSTEPPRVSRRVICLSQAARRLMQLMVVVCLECSRRHMAEGSEQAPVVVPVHPFEGGELDCLAGAPRAAPGDEFGLVQPDDGFGQSLPPA